MHVVWREFYGLDMNFIAIFYQILRRSKNRSCCTLIWPGFRKKDFQRQELQKIGIDIVSLACILLRKTIQSQESLVYAGLGSSLKHHLLMSPSSLGLNHIRDQQDERL